MRKKKRIHRVFGSLLVGLFVGANQAQAATDAFINPLINGGADPWIIFKDGVYHYTHTTGGNVRVRKAAKLHELGSATPITVFTPAAPFNKNVWAPEIHFLNGRWYACFAADDGINANHRMFVAESATADSQSAYVAKGKIYDATTDRWAIDGTVLQKDDGSLYFIWSGWPGSVDGVAQNLYIAPMSNPWTISGPRVLISTPEHAWEGWINEGPQVVKRDGKIFIFYSANASWTDNYRIGLLTNTDGDVLNPASWTKAANPIFQTYADETGGVYGPGHGSFAKSLDQTEDWYVYHAARASGSGWDRTVRAQPVSWNADGTPFLAQPIPTNTPVLLPSGETRPLPTPVTNGLLKVEIFTGISGSTVSALTNHAKFPDHPDITRYVKHFEAPLNMGDNFGARISGLLRPDVTGDYVFYIAGNEQALLFLSTNSDPANKRLIAFEPQWHGSRNWTGTARRPAQENVSAPVPLVAGQWYFVEALMNESTGSDNLAVTWRKPGAPAPANGSPPIGEAFIGIPPDPIVNPHALIVQHPVDRKAYDGMSPGFNVQAASVTPLRHQWQKRQSTNEWRNIEAAYSSLMLISNVLPHHAGDYRAVVKNEAGSTVSSSAHLTVLERPVLTPGPVEPSGRFKMSFTGETGFTYAVQASVGLISWTNIAVITNASGSVQFTDTESNTFSNRSYRLHITP